MDPNWLTFITVGTIIVAVGVVFGCIRLYVYVKVTKEERAQELVRQIDSNSSECLYVYTFNANERREVYKCIVCGDEWVLEEYIQLHIQKHTYKERLQASKQKELILGLSAQIANTNESRQDPQQNIRTITDPAVLTPAIRVCTIYGQNSNIQVYLCSGCFDIYINSVDAANCAASHMSGTSLVSSTYAIGDMMSAAMAPEVESVLAEVIEREVAESEVTDTRFTALPEYRQLLILENNNDRAEE